MKKAQIVGQIFIYILAIIIIGLIALFGYRAIRDFIVRGEEVEFLQFKTNLEGSIDQIRTDYKSVKKVEVAVPGKYREVCFVDLDKETTIPEKRYPIMRDSVEDGIQKNVFLIVDISRKSLYVGKINVLDSNGDVTDHYCFPTVNNKLKMRLEGFGDRTVISEWGVQPSQNVVID